MYKNIKDLNLEIITIEDQVLLVESKVGNGKLNDWVKLSIPEIQRVEEWNKDLVLFCNKIVASTKQLEGLPLLMIEDEDEAKKLWNKFWMSDVIFYNSDIGKAFKGGFEKAKETFKFTEEDLRKALFIKHNGLSDDYIIEFLTKKELWIEIEGCSDCHLNDEYMSSPNCCRQVQPKIIDGKIKAIWK